jgi:hypothetical protein
LAFGLIYTRLFEAVNQERFTWFFQIQPSRRKGVNGNLKIVGFSAMVAVFGLFNSNIISDRSKSGVLIWVVTAL